MSLRYPAALALTLAVVLSARGVAAKAGHRHHIVPLGTPAPNVRDLYSQRALRRAKTILQLKLLELRQERLERLRKAIERRIPVNELLKQP
jgi:hypothetical protein